jgi:hypothetical protein
MVHALEEIRRVLVDGGALIDLRPIADRWPVELLRGSGRQEVACVTDLPQGLTDDATANDAMRSGESRGLFRRAAEGTFPFYYTWDSPREMQEYIDEEWADFTKLSEGAWQSIRSAWALAEADARVGIRVKMLITRWVKANVDETRA